jgi:hypothetical protein
MSKHLLRALLVACITGLVSFPILAQGTVETSGVKGQANSKDAHIKTSNATNSADQKIVPPPSKGGPTAKGPYGTCTLHIDNHTPLFVNLYMNGEFAGTVGPYGDLYPNITPGMAELYARAVFDDGSVLTFGPRDYRCSGSDFVWRLVP